jgi:hypothetical protein
MKTTLFIIFALAMSLLTFAQPKADISCKIWNPKSFCEIPDSIYFADGMVAIHCQLKSDTCTQMDNINNQSGVWLSFHNKRRCSLNLKTDFENIRLIKKSNGRVVKLNALYFSRKYFLVSVSATKLKYHFKGRRDINFIMLFPEAEKGDKIVIDDFIEAEIQ